jgi:hypothetical protein
MTCATVANVDGKTYATERLDSRIEPAPDFFRPMLEALPSGYAQPYLL